MNKNKGSAIILAILLLSFFMALTMSMYFMAEKKAERAGLKSKGTRVLAGIDSGSSVAYYELSLANHLRVRGILDREQDFVLQTGTYTNQKGTTSVNVGGTLESTTIQAILISNYCNYFSYAMAGDYTRKTYTNPDILFTTISRLVVNADNMVTSIEMKVDLQEPSQSEHEGLIANGTKLWEDSPNAQTSIGGYRMPAVETRDPLATGGERITAVYNKRIVMNPIRTGSPELLAALGDFTYNIEVTEVAEINGSGEFARSDIEQIIVEKQ